MSTIAGLAILPLLLGQAGDVPAAPPPTQQQQQQSTPSGSTSNIVVVPPPSDHSPVVIPPQQRTVQVAPCPPPPEPRVVYRDRHRRDPLGSVLVGTFGGIAAGAAIGAGVGLAQADDTRAAWERDIGTGLVVGGLVGAVAGGVIAWIDYDHDRVAVAPMVGGGRAGLAVAGRW